MKAASLSSSLLVRKGSAAPADLSLIPASRRHTVKVQAKAPAPSTCVHKAEIATAKEAGQDGQGNGAYTAKFTLRLDRERHLRLKLLAAHLHLSAQEMLIEALDAYLDQAVPQAIRNNCSCLAQLEEGDH